LPRWERNPDSPLSYHTMSSQTTKLTLANLKQHEKLTKLQPSGNDHLYATSSTSCSTVDFRGTGLASTAYRSVSDDTAASNARLLDIWKDLEFGHERKSPTYLANLTTRCADD